jgi:hypothetical protein
MREKGSFLIDILQTHFIVVWWMLSRTGSLCFFSFFSFCSLSFWLLKSDSGFNPTFEIPILGPRVSGNSQISTDLYFHSERTKKASSFSVDRPPSACAAKGKVRPRCWAPRHQSRVEVGICPPLLVRKTDLVFWWTKFQLLLTLLRL